MSKFKVGDRVAVYFAHPSQASSERVTGKISFIFKGIDCHPFKNDNETIFQIEADNKVYCPSYIHPRQCRKLNPVKRQKLYALVPSFGVDCVGAYFDKSLAEKYCADGLRIVEFVKVKRKK